MVSFERSQKMQRMFNRHLARLVDVHGMLASFVPFRALAAQESGRPFLEFDDDGMLCLMTQSILLSRHISGIAVLLKRRHPVQALVLLRAVMETWFYILMWFDRPDLAADFIKEPTKTNGKPKYKPWEGRKRAIQIVREAGHPHATAWATFLEEQYCASCEMVHMTESSMAASLSILNGESLLTLGPSTQEDQTLWVAYGRILHVSSAFLIVLLLRFLASDDHPHTVKLVMEISRYVTPALKFVGDIEEV